LPPALRSDRIRRDVRRFAPFLAAAVMAVWMAPNAVAVAIGVHLLLDDHHAVGHVEPDDAHDHEVALSPAHTHDLMPARYDTTSRPLITAAVTAEISSITRTTESWRARPQTLAHSPPATSLFLSHCSLLI
jgi:hypothetical protein